MGPTLIRNLSDHHGNNLLHILASYGHQAALAWLCSSCGGQLEGALHDENRSGLTPVTCAVKVSCPSIIICCLLVLIEFYSVVSFRQ